ncbi:Hypothetical predicted protein [Olea europaea subsp. europaea]|uniref:Uncharacterized protein n=1 Tax=Olea europaea subsp. europaea TaxID=158383 RepID=A0A8S0T0U1_OLEEU|nr:Hypothetical predicted protein [Olea europaea subsp. europaea]
MYTAKGSEILISSIPFDIELSHQMAPENAIDTIHPNAIPTTKSHRSMEHETENEMNENGSSSTEMNQIIPAKFDQVDSQQSGNGETDTNVDDQQGRNGENDADVDDQSII